VESRDDDEEERVVRRVWVACSIVTCFLVNVLCVQSREREEGKWCVRILFCKINIGSYTINKYRGVGGALTKA
jgi:hypothetical protein